MKIGFSKLHMHWGIYIKRWTKKEKSGRSYFVAFCPPVAKIPERIYNN
jgi:hypothetical protein